MNESDALIFHPINYFEKDLPVYRMPHQRYVFFFHEAQTSFREYPIFHHPPKWFFNWTMTYRRDSDVYSPDAYGILRRKNKSQITDTFPVELAPGTKPPDPAMLLQMARAENRSLQPDILNKTKKIAWFVSNCDTESKREVFFSKLFQYFQEIDVYGECGFLKCVPWNTPECDKVLYKYKFYISAENTICADYVTEKFYRALDVGVVPIVYGGADYASYAPTHSFIHVDDFHSPKALADYLYLLDQNPSLYLKYFEWKKDWDVIRNPSNGWCDLCAKLNEPNQPTKKYEDIGKWMYEEIPCFPGSKIKK